MSKRATLSHGFLLGLIEATRALGESEVTVQIGDTVVTLKFHPQNPEPQNLETPKP